MRLTAFSDYTLRVLMYLAIDPAKRATIPAIAAAYAISVNHLMKVVQHLAREGGIDPHRGGAARSRRRRGHRAVPR